MVAAQLVEWSLLTTEIRGSKPVIGKVLYIKYSTNCNIEKTKIKKRGQEWPILKKTIRRNIISVECVCNKSANLLKKFVGGESGSCERDQHW